jgi:CheY-like chemotaxis protein
MSAMDRGALIRALPYARRYARALTGSQSRGDEVVAEALKQVLASPPESLAADPGARVALYGAIGDRVRDADTVAAIDLSDMSMLQRMLLLLTALEEQPLTAAAAACRILPAAAELELRLARDSLRTGVATRVLIIEDEPIIAMDIETIVRDLGHNVTGVAVTRDEAVAQARQNPPGLVLADIQLADDSSGIDAVKDILAEFSVPVIFITAFPERLLTGTRPEPTFLITKPFQRSTVKAAIAQALFFDAATVPAG